MATAYVRRSYAGGAISTTVPNGIGAGDTSFTLAASTGWTFTSNFWVTVDRGLSTEEKIECSGITSLVVSVASSGRGADGTSAVAHSPGCTVQVTATAHDMDEANQVVNQVLGQSGAAKGDLHYINSPTSPATLSRLAVGSTGQYLTVASSVPAWATLPLQGMAASSLGSGTTSSASFGALSSTSSTVTVTTGTMALVILQAQISHSTANGLTNVGIAVSGATTIAASATFSLEYQAYGANTIHQAAITVPYGGATVGGGPGALTAGSNVFTAQVKTNGATATISNCLLTVIPLN